MKSEKASCPIVANWHLVKHINKSGTCPFGGLMKKVYSLL